MDHRPDPRVGILNNPANKQKAVPFTAKQFHYAFGNLMSEQESQKVWERYAVPGAGAVLWEGAMANTKRHSPFRIDWAKADRALLILGGGSHHVVPPGLSRSIYKHYEGPATVEYKEYPGRSHYTCGQNGWEEVADHALSWAVEHVKS